MSERRMYNINCPQCQHVQEVQLYESINVSETPELKEALMSNEIHKVNCTPCGFTFRIDKSILYHDPSQQIMIYWIPTTEDMIEARQQEFQESVAELNHVLPDGLKVPDIHLVIKRTELVERIFLLEHKLDARIVEYIKYLIYTKNLSKVDPVHKALLFNAEDSTAEKLYFVIQDVAAQKLEGMLQYCREAYHALSEMFDRDDETANLFELFPGPYINARLLFLSQQSSKPSRKKS